MFVHDRRNVPIPPLIALDNSLQRELLEAPDVLRFTAVRNPYTRLVSAWRDKVVLYEPGFEDVYIAVRGSPPPLENKQVLSFPEFVAHIEKTSEWNQHWQRQVDLCFWPALSFNRIGKFEQLDDLLAHLNKHFNISGAFHRSNETSLRFRASYSEDLAARVQALYAADFIAFDYDAASWPREKVISTPMVSECQFLEAIVERNIIISNLYRQRDRLNELEAKRSRWRNIVKKLGRLVRRVGFRLFDLKIDERTGRKSEAPH
jgi:hypothetical protein